MDGLPTRRQVFFGRRIAGMGSARQKAAREPVVQRCYDPTPVSCASALALLLQSPCKQEMTAEGHHPDGRADMKGRSWEDDFHADTASIPRRVD